MTAYLAAMIVALSGPVAATANDVEAQQKSGLDAASAALVGGHPQAALDAVEPVVAAYAAIYATETRQVYCGMSSVQALAYMTTAAREKKSAVAVGPSYCNALFIKGYALVDLGRPTEARVVYERLVRLAPMDSHFLAELGQSYRPDRNWPKMLAFCGQAADFADLASADRVKTEKGLAWRCMGYALVEQGKLDEAEAMYRKCLEVDPADAKAQGELRYIAGQRRKPS